MVFKLAELPYALDALDPFLSRESLHQHHDNHCGRYVGRLNTAIFEDPVLAELPLEALMLKRDAPPNVVALAADLWNHDFFFACMSPDGGGEPAGDLAQAINFSFGSFEDFIAKFSGIATTHFGSGWVWLVQPADGTETLRVVGTHNCANPTILGLGTPLLALDVYEHAYYDEYRNARGQYVDDFWEVVDWAAAEARYVAANKSSCVIA